MRVIELIDPYKDLLFYHFLFGVIYLIINIINLIEHERRQKLLAVSKTSKKIY